MNRNITIASDSTTDLNQQLIEKYNIKILPLGVHLGNEHYKDGVDIDPEQIYAHYSKHKELPKTSAVNVATFSEFFSENTKDGGSVVLFTISSDMSSTYNNACLAAKSFENVHIVDTRNLSTGGGLLLLRAAELAESGSDAGEIAHISRELASRVDASFVVDDLEFLHKGGRCSAVAALGANLLKLKPCITVKNGKMGVSKKYRGNFSPVLTQYIKDRIGDGSDIDQSHIFITHAGCEKEIYMQCVDLVKQLLPASCIHITRAGCTISSHCGKNTLGVLFIRKHPIVNTK